MDFWTDIAFAVLLRLLKSKAESTKWRNAFLKLARAIDAAFLEDQTFPTLTK
jgi:hypothetical protein